MMTSRLATLFAVGALLLAGAQAQARTTGAEPLDDALRLMQTEPAQGIAVLERLTAEGDIEAKAVLAVFLATNLQDVPTDQERSSRLFEEALAAGSQNARLHLAARQLQNDDPADDESAVALLQGLDQRFESAAAYPLGRAYLFGSGVERDLERGSRLLQVAVEAAPSNIDAQFLLGRAYQNGWGIPVDEAAAYEHLKIAADEGDSRAQWNLGMLLLGRQDDGVNATEAYRYVRMAAEQGHEQGMISLGVMLALGQGVTADPVEARQWYEAAAARGSAHALRALGGMFLAGEGGPADEILGAAMVELAAEAGDANAIAMRRQFAEPLAKLPREDVDAVKTALKRELGPLH